MPIIKHVLLLGTKLYENTVALYIKFAGNINSIVI